MGDIFIKGNGEVLGPNWHWQDAKEKLIIEDSYDGIIPTIITYQAFWQEIKIKEVHLPDSIVKIGDEAFFGCYLMRKVVWSKKLTTIGEHAFDETSLDEIDLPVSVINIEQQAFAWMGKHDYAPADHVLKLIRIPNQNVILGDRLFDLSVFSNDMIIDLPPQFNTPSERSRLSLPYPTIIKTNIFSLNNTFYENKKIKKNS